MGKWPIVKENIAFFVHFFHPGTDFRHYLVRDVCRVWNEDGGSEDRTPKTDPTLLAEDQAGTMEQQMWTSARHENAINGADRERLSQKPLCLSCSGGPCVRRNRGATQGRPLRGIRNGAHKQWCGRCIDNRVLRQPQDVYRPHEKTGPHIASRLTNVLST
jgi:hypothetical protein